MDRIIDIEKTLEIIERLKLAKIGEYKKWESIIKKIKTNLPLNLVEMEYFSNVARIYNESVVTRRSRIYHIKLSEHDKKPPCQMCSELSEYYCNMNDQYFCTNHAVGHDDNEI